MLDGGDTWQGSATALWTQAQDMVDAAWLLGDHKVAGLAPVQEACENVGPPVWEVVETYLKAHKVLKLPKLNVPGLRRPAPGSSRQRQTLPDKTRAP